MPSYADSWASVPSPDAVPANTISVRLYATLIGAGILLGFLMAGLGTLGAIVTALPWPACLAAFLVAVGGFELTNRTAQWTLSLVGHVVSNLALGITLAPLLDGPAAGWFRSVMLLITIGTLLMTVTAYAAPVLVRRYVVALIAGAVAAALAVAGGPALFQAVHGTAPGAVGAVAIAIALLYIDFYWSKALDLPATLDNAVDSACALYLDVVNRGIGLLDRLTTRVAATRSGSRNPPRVPPRRS